MHQRTRFRLYDKGILDNISALNWPTPPDVTVDTSSPDCAQLMLVALDALRDAFLAERDTPGRVKLVFNLPYNPNDGWGWGRVLTQDLSEKGFSHSSLPVGVIALELEHICERLNALVPEDTSGMMIEGSVASLTQHGRFALGKRRNDLLSFRRNT